MRGGIDGLGVRQGLFFGVGGMPLSPLADNLKTAVGIDHWRTGLDDCWGLRGHDIGAEVKVIRGDADHRHQQRGGKADHYNLQVGGAVRCVHRPVHGILQCPFVRLTTSPLISRSSIVPRCIEPKGLPAVLTELRLVNRLCNVADGSKVDIQMRPT